MSSSRLAAMAALVLTGCAGGGDDDPASAARPAVPVRVLEVAPRELVRTYTELATLAAPMSVDVAAEVPGRIAALPFDEGDRVEQGEVVVELDVALAEAQLRPARARAAQAAAGTAQAEARVGAAEALEREAQAGLALATANFERKRQLREQRATPEATFLEARDELTMAEARLAASQAELASARAALTAQAAAIEVAQAEVGIAEVTLERHTVRAPLEGVVVARGPDPGAMIQAGEPILRLEPTVVLRAEVNVPEGLARLVHPGDEVTVRTDLGRHPGRVRLVAPAVARDTRTVKVEVDVQNDDERGLRPGTFARVTFSLERRQGALAVPEHALRRDVEENATVVVVEQGERGPVARVRPVALGLSADGWVEVTEGLRGGEAVVTLGAETVVDGTPVEPTPAPAPAHGGPP